MKTADPSMMFLSSGSHAFAERALRAVVGKKPVAAKTEASPTASASSSKAFVDSYWDETHQVLEDGWDSLAETVFAGPKEWHARISTKAGEIIVQGPTAKIARATLKREVLDFFSESDW